MTNTNNGVLTLSVWLTAQDVNNLLADTTGLQSAVTWCERIGITKVYLEAFGRGLYADRGTLEEAKNGFLAAGFQVSSGVTTTRFGKAQFGTDWKAQCDTDPGTPERFQRIFEYTASLFDEIIIDDWHFTNCRFPDRQKRDDPKPFAADAGRRGISVVLKEYNELW